MGIVTSLTAIGGSIDQSLAFWSVLMVDGKEWNERQLIPTLKQGQRGLRKLDWTEDLVSTGDIHRIKELRLHCPDGRTAILELTEPGEMRSRWPSFQFKTKTMNMLGAGNMGLEYHVIGRVLDKESGRCECFIWDYRPEPGEQNLVAYKSSIYNFGAWRKNITPLSALSLDVQGFKVL